MAGHKRKAPADAADAPGADSRVIGEPRMTGAPHPGRSHRPAPGVAADGYFRRLYAAEPDFRQLAKQDGRFAAMWVLLFASFLMMGMVGLT